MTSTAAARPAYRVDGRPIDRRSFYAIACDPGRSVVVEACAGAGKTWMLVSRILRALLAGAAPQEILAITFTRKAAGEMRERLNDWLAHYGSPATSHRERVEALVDRGLTAAEAERQAPRLQQLRDEVLLTGRPVEIRTFHAWFAQLLRAAPLELLDELGLQPDMELIETLDDHRPEVFRRFHAGLLRDPELLAEHRRLVAERGRSQARKWLEMALERRVELELADAAGVLEGSMPADLIPGGGDPAAELLQPPWQARLRALAALLRHGKATAQGAAEGVAAALSESAEGRTVFRLLWRTFFTDDDAPRLRLRASTPEVAELQDELQLLARRLRQSAAHAEHRRMVGLSRLLLAEYAGYKRARGLADMADLERCGLALLRDSTLAGWVQERLDARIRHLLIDEFQDTSPLQWQALLAWLSGYGGAGGGASGQRPPGVFIVGDPKQSIYRFRRAEPRVFEAAKHFVVDGLGGRVLACDHTRRNAPAVLRALNAVFGEATDTGEFEGYRPHTTEVGSGENIPLFDGAEGPPVAALPRVPRPPAEPRAGKSGGAPAERIWRDSLTVPRRLPEEVLREQEAAQVAEAVRGLVDGRGGVAAVAPADILILCRKRESLRLAEQALRRLQLPCAAVEDFQLMAAPEAQDVVALLDAVVSTRHRLSLARALRSPVFGASDDDLLWLARTADRDDWWGTLMRVGADGRPALWRAAGLLRGWREAAARLPPHDLLDRIVHEGDVHARMAAAVPPAQRLAAQEAVDAVLGQALTLDGARYATPYNLVRALRRRAIRVAAPGQGGAVRLLTVHGAKGLEARVVFVMDSDPEPKPPETVTLLCEWPVESPAPRRCAFVYSESACPPALEGLLADEVEARRREELNGLYVAMTRARERLVFSGTEPRRRAGRSWWERVEPWVTPWEPRPARLRPRAAPPLGGRVGRLEPTLFGAPATEARASVEPARLRVIEPLPARRAAARQARAAGALAGRDDDARRLGQAVHRWLEWAVAAEDAASRPTALAGVAARPLAGAAGAAFAGAAGTAFAGAAAAADHLPWAEAAAAEFPVNAAAEVLRLGRQILHSPDCSRFLRGPALRWAGNEVAVSDAGEALRIDRLVQIDDGSGPVWWVLDYKLQHRPDQLPAYRDQLRRYRRLLERAEPGARVRCAFITGSGAVVEVD